MEITKISNNGPQTVRYVSQPSVTQVEMAKKLNRDPQGPSVLLGSRTAQSQYPEARTAGVWLTDLQTGLLSAKTVTKEQRVKKR